MENTKQNKDNPKEAKKTQSILYYCVIIFLVTVELFKSHLKIICIFPYFDSHPKEKYSFSTRLNFKIPAVLVSLCTNLIHEDSTLMN